MENLAIYQLDESRTLQLKSDRDRVAAFLGRVVKPYPPKMVAVVLNSWIRNANEYTAMGDRCSFGAEFLYDEAFDAAMIRSCTSHGHCSIVYGLGATQMASLGHFFEAEGYVEWRTCRGPNIDGEDFGCLPHQQMKCSLLVEAVKKVAEACGNALYFSHDAAEAYCFTNI